MNTTIEQAIQRSISQSEIVTLPWSEEGAAELLAECEDSATNDLTEEFWGTDDDGGEWRVHLRRPGDVS